MYNIKEFYYPDGVQTRIYARAYGEIRDNVPKRKTGNSNKERSKMVSRNRSVNKIYELARANKWAWFVTITFDPDKVDRYNYDAVTKKLSVWLNNLKKNDKDIKYLLVPEMHADGAFHFHGLFNCSSALDMVDSGKTDSKGRPIFNIGKYKFGWTTATFVSNNEAVTKYITKYVTKDLLENVGSKKHYWHSRNLSKPEVVCAYLEDNADKRILEDELLETSAHSKVLFNDVSRVSYFEGKEGVLYG